MKNILLGFLVTTCLFAAPFLKALHGGENAGATKPVPERVRIGFNSIRAEESSSFLEFLAADELQALS